MKKNTELTQNKESSAAKIFAAGLRYFHDFIHGCFNRTQFIMVVVCLFMLQETLKNYLHPLLSFLGQIFIGCLLLIAVHKRCQDIKIKGTLYILIYALTLPTMTLDKYLLHHNIDLNIYLSYGMGFLCLLFLVVHLFLLFCPGKKEKDLAYCSPLDKHPWLFLCVWSALYLTGGLILVYVYK